MSLDPRRRGLLLVLLAALLWASSAVLGKGLFTTGVTPSALVQARCTLGAAALGLYLALFGRRHLAIRPRDLPPFALLGLAMAAVQTCYFQAVAAIPVAAAILLQYTSAFLVMGFSVALLGERLTRGKLAALGLAIGGCFLVAGGYDLELAAMNRAGVAWGLGAAVLFAAYTLFGARLMRRHAPLGVLFFALAFAAIPVNALAPPLGFLAAFRDPSSAAKILYVALLGTVAPFGLYLAGVRLLGASTASIAAMAEPVLSAGIAFAILGEALEPPQVAGALGVIGAVVVLERFRGGEGAVSRGSSRADS
jgi:drug/metabolite transporter (DMT)-like permease